MTTNVTPLVPSLDSSGRITSITITGDSDRPRIEIHITSPSNPGFVPTSQTFPDAIDGTWSVTLTGSVPPDALLGLLFFLLLGLLLARLTSLAGVAAK